jgi:CRP-like cAMP-binding protein
MFTYDPLLCPPRFEGGPRNRLLRALPADEFDRLRSDLSAAAIRHSDHLATAGQPLCQVLFPNGGMYSLTTVLADGTMIEAATVGDEGVLGIEAFFADHPVAIGDVMMQVPGTDAMTMTVPAFRRHLARSPALRELIGRYAHALFAQTIQLTACNALHQMAERCARWLLMIHDRVRSDEFRLSHELLAMMLGCRRPSVTIVARMLQEQGLISYRHGRMRVVDRPGLERATCDCYAIIRAHFDRLGLP